jgi:hypothetical protein
MNIQNIPTFSSDSLPNAATKLCEWFNANGHTATVELLEFKHKVEDPGNGSHYEVIEHKAKLIMKDFDWADVYAHQGAGTCDSPDGDWWLVEPYDEHELIFSVTYDWCKMKGLL